VILRRSQLLGESLSRDREVDPGKQVAVPKTAATIVGVCPVLSIPASYELAQQNEMPR
jgi:hypothetical protein